MNKHYTNKCDHYYKDYDLHKDYARDIKRMVNNKIKLTSKYVNTSPHKKFPIKFLPLVKYDGLQGRLF